MKIDIHTHTKKVKQGDPESRNIDATKFSEIINKTDVKILAITNHNHFDHQQYIEFKNEVHGTCQIWPGVEFDILEDGRRAHLITIANPKNAETFGKIINEVIGSVSADTFTINLDDVVSKFNAIDVIFIAHYHSKKPWLSDKDVDKLVSLVSNSKRVLKEASNSISAGIYINHGHNSIHGSDVQNWDNYESDSKNLPELRLPVESFEQFCLLLDKDDITINTILNQKTKESIQITPFGIDKPINLDIYNDINILFGSKGTGKSEILKALSTYYNGKGFKTQVYESNSNRLEDLFDLRGNLFTIDIEDLEIDNCSAELVSIRNAIEKNVTSLSVYNRYYSDEATNQKAKSIKVNQYTPLDENSPKRIFYKVKSELEKFTDFKKYITSNVNLEEIIGDDLLNELNGILESILERINLESGKRFVDFKTIKFFNNLIQVFVDEISRKTGKAVKPTKIGFYEYASNRIAIEKAVKKIKENISKSIAPIIDEVGDLGEKGKLFCQTNLIIQDGSNSDSKFKHLQSKQTKRPQKEVASLLDKISKQIYSNTLFEKIDELKRIEGSETVTSIGDLLLFNRHFTLNGSPYTPSTGESSMVLLHNELMEDKEIYLIDEPEKSLGNDYISEVIVPLIKERARSGKIVIIATHDANIAVRTLPYNSIYREHDINGYYTYSGNPFSNNLICNPQTKPKLDWKLISMKTLEGGKSAFGERGKIYGNT